MGQYYADMHNAMGQYYADMHNAMGQYYADMHNAMGQYYADMHNNCKPNLTASILDIKRKTQQRKISEALYIHYTQD